MISIIIPAYNEEKRLGKTIEKIKEYCKKFSEYEIIVVDDCSKDNTARIAESYNVRILRNEINRGKGYSVKKGMLNANYPLVLFTDSDLATPIEELDKLMEYIKAYDVVIASRGLKESNIKVEQPFYRQFMGKTFPFFVNLIALLEFKDTQCGFKLFKKETINNIFNLQRIEGFCFDVEILFIAKKLGYKIKELPVTWIDKEGSKVNPLKDSFKMFKDLIKIRINDLLGKYSKIKNA